MSQKALISSKFSTREIAGSILLLAICILPFFAFAKDKKIYVDKSYSGTEDGTKNHPYQSISKALKNTSKATTVEVAKGTYRENIEVPSGVTIAGSERDEVIIEADDRDEPVVKMKHKTQLDEVTVKNGKIGILINDGDQASVSECIIKDNDKEGIKIESASVKSKYEARITDNLIENNGKNGIFSQKRKLSITKNRIINNDGDGIGIMPGSSAWVASNTIKDNDGSGMRVNLDGSSIWTKNNTYRENKREGIEIDSDGGKGRIDINKSKFWDNQRWAIARIQKSGGNANWWGLTIQGNNEFIKSQTGNVSPIIHVN